MKKATQSQRLQSIDTLKGIALVGMVLFHLLFLINFLGLKTVDQNHYAVFLLGRISAIIFIYAFGMTLYLAIKKIIANQTYFLRFWVRVLKMITIATSITLCSFVVTPQAAIYFGIIHFFSLCLLIMGGFFLWCCHISKNITLSLFILSLTFVMIFIALSIYNRESWLLMVFGWPPSTFSSLDYYPFFPWVFLVLVGMWSMHLITPIWLHRIDSSLQQRPLQIVSVLGKYSLTIYLIHVPLFLLILYGLLYLI